MSHTHTVRPPTDLTRSTLFRAVCDSPDDDLPRLVFADYLDECGDRDRAEFIRLQCQLARMQPWEDGYVAAELRAESLFRRNIHRWPHPFGKPLWFPNIRRLSRW